MNALGKRDRVNADRPLNTDEGLLFTDSNASRIHEPSLKRPKIVQADRVMESPVITGTESLVDNIEPVGKKHIESSSMSAVFSQTTTETPQ